MFYAGSFFGGGIPIKLTELNKNGEQKDRVIRTISTGAYKNCFFALIDFDDAELIDFDVNKNICGQNNGKIFISNYLYDDI